MDFKGSKPEQTSGGGVLLDAAVPSPAAHSGSAQPPAALGQGCPRRLQHKPFPAQAAVTPASPNQNVLGFRYFFHFFFPPLFFGIAHSKGSKFRNRRCPRAFGSQPDHHLQRKQSNFTSTPVNPRPAPAAVPPRQESGECRAAAALPAPRDGRRPGRQCQVPVNTTS